MEINIFCIVEKCHLFVRLQGASILLADDLKSATLFAFFFQVSFRRSTLKIWLKCLDLDFTFKKCK